MSSALLIRELGRDVGEDSIVETPACPITTEFLIY